jgi:hypothetical protein
VALLLVTTGCATRVPPAQLGPVAADRPSFTESPVVVPVGHSQLEAGQTFTREAGQASFALGEALVRTGLTSWLELRTALNSYAIEQEGTGTVAGFEDAGVAAKLILQPGRGAPSWRPALAVIAGTSLPTGTTRIAERQLLPSVKLLSAWDVSERFVLTTNLNWGHDAEEGRRVDEWSASGSLDVGLTERVGGYVEVYGVGRRLGVVGRRAYVNAGTSWQATPALQLDLRVGTRAGTAGGFFTGVGLTRRW